MTEKISIANQNQIFNLRKEETNLQRMEYEYKIQEQEFDLRIDQAKFEPIRLDDEKNRVLAGIKLNIDGTKTKIKKMKEDLNNV